MNISLLYQGNNYNFDLRKDVNIKYIKDLASKLISKDISTFDLLYNKIILSNYDESIFIKDLTKCNHDNINILIMQKDKKCYSNDILKKKKIKKDSDSSKNTNNINNIRTFLNSPLSTPLNAKNKIGYKILKKKNNKASMEYISENKVFEDIYNSKENEIISLMNLLSQKIKEYDDVLYKNFRNNSYANNNEISLYEKYVLEFKDKQIIFLKKLINSLDVNEQDFSSGMLQLNEFYKELNQYNNQSNIILHNNIDSSKNKEKKNNIINNLKLLAKSSSKTKLNENIFRNYIADKKLPLLLNSKTKNSRYQLSLDNNNTIHSNDSKENESNKEDNKNIIEELNINSDYKKPNNMRIIKQRPNNEFPNRTEIKEIIKNNNIFEDKLNKINKFNIISKNRKSFNNKGISQSNTNDNTNTSHNTTIRGNIVQNNRNDRLKIHAKTQLKNNLYKSNNNSTQRLTTVMNQKKAVIYNSNINTLLEESENKKEINSHNSDSSDASGKRKFSNDNGKDWEERVYNIRKTKRTKREKTIKKMGSNIYDFLI